MDLSDDLAVNKSHRLDVAEINGLNFTGSGDVASWFVKGRYALDNIENLVRDYIESCGTNIRRGCKIHPSAVIGENVFIDEDVEIGPHCYVRSNAILFHGCRLGFGVELDRCILFQDVVVAHHACIGRTVVGQSSNLAYGFVVATKKLTGRPVSAVFGDHTFISKRRHHGALIGSGLRTGVNVSVMPGTTILQDASIGPNRHVSGVIGANAIVK